MNRPESVFWERIGAKTVLIAHHDEFIVKLLADKCKVADDALCECQLFEAVNLFVCRLLDERSVTVYK